MWTHAHGVVQFGMTVIFETKSNDMTRVVKEGYGIEMSQRCFSATSVVFDNAVESLIGL